MEDAAAASSSSSSSSGATPTPSSVASPESARAKRRRVDRYALGFEFVPRPTPSAPSGGGSGGCGGGGGVRGSPEWTEESTFALLDAWGERFVRAGRRSLRADEWSEVARLAAVAASRPAGYYSEAQCRNRLDTLKKKYKKEKEKSRLAALHSRSSSSTPVSGKWVYFDKMESLMSPPPPFLSVPHQPPPPPQSQPSRRRHPPTSSPVPPMPRLAWGVDAGEYVSATGGNAGPGDSGSETELGNQEGNGVGPEKRPADSCSEFAMLAESIRKFGEIYERMESNKQQQMVELERMRKDFQRDLEARRREILEKAQAEIAKISEAEEEEEEEADDEDEGEDDEGDDERLDNDEDDEEDHNGALDASP